MKELLKKGQKRGGYDYFAPSTLLGYSACNYERTCNKEPQMEDMVVLHHPQVMSMCITPREENTEVDF